MAVIVGPSRLQTLGPFVEQYMRNMTEQQMEKDRLAQQAPLVQAQAGYYNAQTEDTQQKQQMAMAEAAAKGALSRYQTILKDDPQKAAAFIQNVMQAIPATKPILESYGIVGPTTNTDVANQNAGKFVADQTALAAGGSEDAQARNAAFQVARGEQLSAPAMGDQVQRQTLQPGLADKGTDYGKTVRTEGRLLPTGGEKLQAQTQVQTEGMRQAGETARTEKTLQAQKDIQTQKEQANIPAGDPASARDVRRTVSGKVYADISGYSQKRRDDLKAYYEDAGIPTVDDKAVSSELRDVDVARQNTSDMFDSLKEFFPKDAQGRITVGPENKLSEILQTGTALGAYGSWRAGAIRNLRAVAGSRGLRINRSEIQLAIDNDIPQLTDTIAVAQERIRNLNKMFDNIEQANIGRGVNRPPFPMGAHAAPRTDTTKPTGNAVDDFLARHGIGGQ